MPVPAPRDLVRRASIGGLIGLADGAWTLGSSPYGGAEPGPVLAATMAGWMVVALGVAPHHRNGAPAIGLAAGLFGLLAFAPLPGPLTRISAALGALVLASVIRTPGPVGVVGLAVAFATWAWRGAPEVHPATHGDRPSVLLVTVDTWRADSRSGSPSPLAPSLTPFLDALAERGCAVSPAFSTSPLTGPSHAAMHSGVHPIDLGVLLNARSVPDDAPWLAERLAAAGYRTEAWVSSAMLDRDLGFGRGFMHYDDDLDGWGELRASGLGFLLGPTDAAAAFERPGAATLDRFAAGGPVDGPLFAWVHVYDPHRPYLPSEEGLSRVPDELPLPAATAFDGHPVGPPPIRGMAGGQLAALHFELFGGAGPRPTAEREHRDATAHAAAQRYLGEVADTDALVARAFALFEARTGSAPQVWAVVGDHGESLSEHHEIGSHQRHVYRANTEVPLLLSPGDCPAGPVSTVVLADALEARAGLGPAPDWHTPVVSAVLGPAHGRQGEGMIRKLAYRQDTRTLLVTLPKAGRTTEFYDLANDPHERFVLPADDAMLEAAGPWIEALSGAQPQDADASMTEALEALGYVQ